MITKPKRYTIGVGTKSVSMFNWFTDGREYACDYFSFKSIRRDFSKIVTDKPIFTNDEKTYIFFNHLKNKPLNLWK